MNDIEAKGLLIKSLDREMHMLIEFLSEGDVASRFSVKSMDFLPKSFLEAQWENRDFELLLDLTGNLDAPL